MINGVVVGMNKGLRVKHIFIEILISHTAAAGNDESAPPLLCTLMKKRAQAA